MAKVESYQDLLVWQKSMDFAVAIYRSTQSFPPDERYGLTSQIRRSSVSIPSNIAEGSRRSSKTEFVRFLRIAYGSGAELETQVELAWRLQYLENETYQELRNVLTEIMKMLNGLISSLSSLS